MTRSKDALQGTPVSREDVLKELGDPATWKEAAARVERQDRTRRRPGDPLVRTSTPSTLDNVRLLGGDRAESECFSRDEMRHLRRLYGFTPPVAETSSRDPNVLHNAGDTRNLIRGASSDGRRMIAFAAKYMDAYEDPVRWLVRLVSEAGYDVDPQDLAWAQDEPEEGAGEDDGEE